STTSAAPAACPWMLASSGVRLSSRSPAAGRVPDGLPHAGRPGRRRLRGVGAQPGADPRPGDRPPPRYPAWAGPCGAAAASGRRPRPQPCPPLDRRRCRMNVIIAEPYATPAELEPTATDMFVARAVLRGLTAEGVDRHAV